MYKEIDLNQIKTNPNNPRTNFKGQKFDDLVKSIQEKGVLEPILVRPMGDKFEIIAGERRFRALKKFLVNIDGVIPAIVRKFTDAEALEVMIIENLQREDLTPIEEVKSFAVYIEKHGKDGVGDLAAKTGIQATYIRRRIEALSLPQKALKAWDKGDLSFGHLEELIRIKDKDFRKEIMDQLLDGWRRLSVKDLRELINNKIPRLSNAKFDLAECSICHENSDVQKKLWDIELMKKVHCLNPKCFKEKQRGYIQENWNGNDFYKQFKTSGFVFNFEIGWADYKIIHSTPFKKCLNQCEHFKTILRLTGSLDEGKVCIKNEKCFNSLSTSQVRKSEKKDEQTGPRVPWHGQYFREEFFKEAIPIKFMTVESDDVKMLRAILFSMINLDQILYKEFSGDKWLSQNVLFKRIKKMTKEALFDDIKELSLITILSGSFDAEERRLFAEHIGIKLAAEWKPTDEFFRMKTKKELIEWGMKSGILKEKKAEAFLKETLKRRKFISCKKSELISLFQDSGVKLLGKVPDEILK